jgi:DNA-directed RNA polymerase alpha subunit
MANYISVECPHCGKEAARLRFGESQLTASNAQPEAVTLSPEEQAKLKTIDDLDLSVRAYNCLKMYFPAIRTVGDLIQYRESDLLYRKRMGRKSLNELNGVLANMNLSLAACPRPELSATHNGTTPVAPDVSPCPR